MIKIYSKEHCGYCERAKVMVRNYGLEHQNFMLDKDFTLDEVKELVSDSTKGLIELKTFPAVFIDNKYIGGYVDLQDYIVEEGLI